MKTVFAILASCLLLSFAEGADILVDNVKGSDKGDGTEVPFRRINDAVQRAKPGDRIVIANTGQHYLESIQLASKCGTPDKPIVIEGNGAAISGLRELPAEKWQERKNGVYFYQPRTLRGRYIGFPYLITNGQRIPRAASLEAIQPGEHIWLKEGIYVKFPEGKDFTSWPLSGTVLFSGYVVRHSSYLTCRNLKACYFANDGFNFHGSCRGLLFHSIESGHNGDDGFSLHQDADATVDGGYFHHNRNGIANVGASRSFFFGITSESNHKVGIQYVGGFHSLVDSVSINNQLAQIGIAGGRGASSIGFARNHPLGKCAAFIKNVVVQGEGYGIHVQKNSSVSISHSVVSGATVGISVEDNAVCHITASVIHDCEENELHCVPDGDVVMRYNVVWPGRMQWKGETIDGSNWEQETAAQNIFFGNVLAQPVSNEDGTRLIEPKPQRSMAIGPDKTGSEILKKLK